MPALQFLSDMVLHLDRHLVELLARYDLWLYAILFLIIFAETGLVITPFLPGDSLLFGAGALSAIDTSHRLQLPCAYNGRHRLFRLEHLQRAAEFFRRHGALAIALSRFVPIVRTFMPFTAGIARMPVASFQLYNAIGGGAWVTLFLCGGFLFGNLPLVKNNFGLVTVLIILLSLLPLLWALRQERGLKGKPRG